MNADTLKSQLGHVKGAEPGREVFVDVRQDDGTYRRYSIDSVCVTTHSFDDKWHVVLTAGDLRCGVTAGARQ